MKDDHKQTGRLVHETMNSLDNIKRASPAPYLLTRIKTRMQRNTEQVASVWYRLGSLLSQPKVATIGLLLLLLINTLIITMSGHTGSQTDNGNNLQQNEFAIGVVSIYEPETIEP